MTNSIPNPDYSQISLERQEAEAHLLNVIYDHREEQSAEAWAINQRLSIPGQVGHAILGISPTYAELLHPPHTDAPE